MCQQQQNDMNSQIEIFLENGMPRKFGKSVAKTLKKRAAAAASRNNNNRAVNCKKCGGFFNSNNNDFYENQCVCSGDEDSTASCSSSAFSSTSPSSDEDDNNLQSKSSSHSSSISDDDSDESLVDSDTGFRSSRRKSSSRTTTARTGCPMAALFAAKNKILNTESQTSSPMKSLPSASDLQHVSTASGEKTFKDDLLAISTKLTRKAFSRVDQILSKVQKSKTYRILSRTTQPAHVIAVSIVSFVMLAVWPTLLENEEAAINGNKRRSGLALVTYLGAFATHFGAQIWMTFVSGLALYFALPRHTFGLCQQILFPKYFAMNSMLSILTLILFCKVIAGRWEFSSYVQVIALSTCAIIEVTVRLYLAPPLLRLMREKHKFEVTVGSGTEIGTLEPGDLVKCPHYQGIHKAFRRIHMAVAMGNMTVLVCTFMHLHYLASKLSV